MIILIFPVIVITFTFAVCAWAMVMDYRDGQRVIRRTQMETAEWLWEHARLTGSPEAQILAGIEWATVHHPVEEPVYSHGEEDT